MYKDTIKVANKIISYKDLLEILSKMQEKLLECKKISNYEENRNKPLNYREQIWSLKDSGSYLKFDVNFYDDTNIKFDNYNNFISVFNSRLDEIKSIYVRLCISYSSKSIEGNYEHHHQYLSMDIYETKMNIDVSLSSSDNRIDEVYELIKTKILNAPTKYDNVIKNKTKINTIVSLAIGFIPAAAITIILMFIPTIRNVFATSYVLFPICCTLLAFFIGGTVGSTKLDKLYKSIVPEKKYAGYDRENHKSIYKDDIDKYVETSEILIGKNADNLDCRIEIEKYYNKWKKYLPYEIIAIMLCSIIILFFK